MNDKYGLWGLEIVKFWYLFLILMLVYFVFRLLGDWFLFFEMVWYVNFDSLCNLNLRIWFVIEKFIRVDNKLLFIYLGGVLLKIICFVCSKGKDFSMSICWVFYNLILIDDIMF